jgi:hypothetical protein
MAESAGADLLSVGQMVKRVLANVDTQIEMEPSRERIEERRCGLGAPKGSTARAMAIRKNRGNLSWTRRPY